MFSLVFSQVGFESLGKFTAGEHDTPTTAFAFQTNIRAKACNGPFVGAAGMLFAEAQVVIKAKVWEHGVEIYDWDVV